MTSFKDFDRSQRDRMLTYDSFFNPDQTLKELSERYGLEPSGISRVISKHFREVNDSIMFDLPEKKKFEKLVKEIRKEYA